MARYNRLLLAIGIAALCAPGAALARGGSNGSRLVIPLQRVGSDADVVGRAEFRSERGRSRFIVRVARASANQLLSLSVGGIERATATAGSNGEATLTFRAGSSGGGHRVLDFDPRTGALEIADASGPILSANTGAAAAATLQESARLAPTGVQPAATGKASLRRRGGRTRFTVEIEHVAAGSYDVLIGGVQRATIGVAAGEGEVEFASASDDADKLPLDFDPFGASIEIARGGVVVLSGTLLAQAPGVSQCTAGETLTPLVGTAAAPGASGKARLRVRDDCRRDYEVEVEDVAVGSYDLLVGGTLRASLTVRVRADGGTQGEIEFSSDASEVGKLPLDFDPSGAVEIQQGGVVFLTGTPGGPGPQTCEPLQVEPALDSTGADGNAKGKARFRQDADCDRDLRVEIEKLAAGNYELRIGGALRGTIAVGALGEGEIEFDSKSEPGKLPLDFDPRGQTVEVRQGGTIFLTGSLPS
ncbi:MAG: hypothetical protein ACRERC_07260 [Candidatus Binatia bacterium]